MNANSYKQRITSVFLFVFVCLSLSLTTGCSSNKRPVIQHMHSPDIPEALPLIFVDNQQDRSAKMAKASQRQVQNNHYSYPQKRNSTSQAHPRIAMARRNSTVNSARKFQHQSNNATYPNRRVNQNRAKSNNNARYTLHASNSRSTNKPLASRQRLVQQALAQLGVKYKYGGKSRSGFDCSGLIQHVYANTGISVPRTAAKQRDHSRTIQYSELKPGDLIFFKTGKRTNHVGIYIGDKQFVHASSGSKRVKVDSLDKSYWKRTFVKFGSYLA